MSQDYVPPLPKSSSNVNGCLIGCLVVAVVGVLGAGIFGFTVYKMLQSSITAYTEEAPRELPALELSDDEMTAANEKLAQFRSAVESGTGPREFAFNAEELNVMLRSSEPGQVFGDSVYLTIANGEIRGEVSFDIGKLIPILDGRFANGSATFTVYTAGGMLHVYMESFQVKGEEASQEFMDGMAAQNWAQEVSNDPEFKAWIEKIDEIRVEDDKLIVKLKEGAAAAPAEGASQVEITGPGEAPATEEVVPPGEAASPAETERIEKERIEQQDSERAQSISKQIVYATRVDNIRSGPSTKHAVVRRTQPLERLNFESKEGAWYKLSNEGGDTVEWVHESVVVFEGGYQAAKVQSMKEWAEWTLKSTAVTYVEFGNETTVWVRLTHDKYTTELNGRTIAEILAKDYCLATGNKDGAAIHIVLPNSNEEWVVGRYFP
jgi:hypothetical protein